MHVVVLLATLNSVRLHARSLEIIHRRFVRGESIGFVVDTERCNTEFLGHL